MAIGGVPHYLNRIQKGISAVSNINQLCFKEGAPLVDEFDKLFKSFLPIGNEKRGIYFRLIDEYCDFYLKWIEPERKTLSMSDHNNNYWQQKFKSPSFASWSGYAFESLCYKHIGEIKSGIGIKVGCGIGSWKYVPIKTESKGAQIDLLFECDDGVTYICEIKMTGKPFVLDKEQYHNWLMKAEAYRKISGTSNEIFFVLISASGLRASVYSEELIVKTIELDVFCK